MRCRGMSSAVVRVLADCIICIYAATILKLLFHVISYPDQLPAHAPIFQEELSSAFHLHALRRPWLPPTRHIWLTLESLFQ